MGELADDQGSLAGNMGCSHGCADSKEVTIRVPDLSSRTPHEAQDNARNKTSAGTRNINHRLPKVAVGGKAVKVALIEWPGGCDCHAVAGLAANGKDAAVQIHSFVSGSAYH